MTYKFSKGHPPISYKAARISRKVLIRERMFPGSCSKAEIENATEALKLRSAYLSWCHRQSPHYKPKAERVTIDRAFREYRGILKKMDYLRRRAPGYLEHIVEYARTGIDATNPSTTSELLDPTPASPAVDEDEYGF